MKSFYSSVQPVKCKSKGTLATGLCAVNTPVEII